jgi:hypothetical protein
VKRKGKGTDTMARVKQAAGAGAEVSPWSQAALPDIELFWVSSKTPAGKLDGRGVAVVAGKLPWLEGDKAMAAIAAAGISDAPTLARAVIFLLLGRGELIEKGTDFKGSISPAQRAAITPPIKTADTLEFCYFAGRPGVLKVRADVKTWNTTSTSIDSVAQAGQDPIELATAWLTDPGEARNKMGIDKLVASCTDPRAPAALLTTVQSHPKASTRALAAGGLATCKHTVSAPALAAALSMERDVAARKALVQALGSLAVATTRPALEKVAKDDGDAEVRSYAEWALGKLPRP